MQSPDSKSNDNNAYYGYGNEGYGYGYGEEPTQSRNLSDYLLILRERIWWLIASVLIVLIAAIIYTFNTTPLYRASATFQILRDEETSVDFGPGVVDNQIKDDRDLMTQIKIFESGNIVKRVSDRLKGDDLSEFMAPYRDTFTFSGPLTPVEVLSRNRAVIPVRESMMVAVSYTHTDPEVAAKIAQMFADEYLAYNIELESTANVKAADDLKLQADQQRQKVEKLEMQLAEFKERHKSVTFDETTDVEKQDLIKLSAMLTDDKQALDSNKVYYDQIQSFKAQGKPLWELSFISNNTQVAMLLQQLSTNKIDKATLSKRYRDGHPKMIELNNTIVQVQEELQDAVAAEARRIEAQYELSQDNYENSKQRLADKQQDIIAIEKVRVEYNSLDRDLDVQKRMYDALESQKQVVMTSMNVDKRRARIVDKASPPLDPFKPNIVMNIAMGLFGGFALGFGLVFTVAFVDDRVKTAFDIETAIGLPLIGLVPRIKSMAATEKSRASSDGADKRTVEAFRSIISALQLNEESKKAKVLLTTSTIPGEGKSFVSSNIAMTYANNGERVCLIDCDLRMPNVAKSLELQNEKGVIDFYDEGTPVEELVHSNVIPNLDVMPTGGKARNPTQLLSSSKFENLIHELRMRYDKVIIDSPPLAPVSDALNILPLVDGVVYVIRFNTVKRRSAKNNVRRLMESNTPVFGAVLNNISTNVASYYYSHYYDRQYDSYYIDASPDMSETDEASAKSGSSKVTEKV